MNLVERVARAMFVPMPGETWETADSFARECYLKSSRAAIAVVLEEAAKECERIWKEAPNERTDSPLTSFRQNEISHGCVACAAAIRALNPKERP